MFKGGKSGILAIEINDENTLYQHYMSFVQGGGLFVPTKKTYDLGDELFFSLEYLFTARPYPHDWKSCLGCPQRFRQCQKRGCRCPTKRRIRRFES